MISNLISPEVAQLYSLLHDYSFDVEAYAMDVVISNWLEEFDIIWVSHAITEALYQGRYKVISVEQILRLWQRRGQPLRHFNREFETIILGQTMMFYPEAPQPQENRALLPHQTVTENDLSPGESQIDPSEEHGPGPDFSLSLPNETRTYGKEQVSFEVVKDWMENHPDPTPMDLAHWFRSDMPVPNFQAVTPARGVDLLHPEPIRPFVPRQEASAMHRRLKAVVKAGSSH
jgi:hypothetical protein